MGIGIVYGLVLRAHSKQFFVLFLNETISSGVNCRYTT